MRRFRYAKFDAVVAAWMFHHVPEVDTALAECAARVEGGGRARRSRGSMIRPAELIERKRNGEELSAEEIARARARVRAGRGAGLPDGRVVHGRLFPRAHRRGDLRADRRDDPLRRDPRPRAALGRRVTDKHSTGGVGDKTSIAVGADRRRLRRPLRQDERAAGWVTRAERLDKLESIPGFQVELTTEEFIDQVREIGLAIVDSLPTWCRPTRSSTHSVTSRRPSTSCR